MFVEHLNFIPLVWTNPCEGQVEMGAWEDLFEPLFFFPFLEGKKELEELSKQHEIEAGHYKCRC